MITKIAPSMVNYDPVIWLLFYLSALLLHNSGNYFWRFNFIIAIVSILILLIFCLGSLPFVDFSTYAVPNDGDWFVGGVAGFMSVLRLAPWFYVGVESLVLATNEVDNPRVTIMKGQVSCIFTLAVTSIIVLFVTASLPPGAEAISEDLVPFNRGFVLMFKCHTAVATTLSIPATYATAFGFMFSYSKIISAMADSSLFPSVFKAKRNGVPYVAMVAGAVVGYGICVLQYLVPHLGAQLFNICILGAFFTYISQCIGFLYLRTKFSSIRRSWYSPLGVPGAIFSIIVWLLSSVSVIAFAGDHQFALIVLTCVMTAFSLYYLTVAKHQKFSEEERTILFPAHVINCESNSLPLIHLLIILFFKRRKKNCTFLFNLSLTF